MSVSKDHNWLLTDNKDKDKGCRLLLIKITSQRQQNGFISAKMTKNEKTKYTLFS